MRRVFGYSLLLNIILLNTIFAQELFTDQGQIPTWGQAAVQNLVDQDIISGNDDGSLSPLRNINRAEFLKILTTATDTQIINHSGRSFPDVPRGAWFAPYVHTAVSQGWAKGYPDGTFKPGNRINRAEIAKLLSEAWDIELTLDATDKDWFDVYVRGLAQTDLLPYRANFENFIPAKTPTRIEVFEQLDRVLTIPKEVVIPAIEEGEIPATTTNTTATTSDGRGPIVASTANSDRGQNVENSDPKDNPTTPPVEEDESIETPLSSDQNTGRGVLIPSQNGTENSSQNASISLSTQSTGQTQVIFPGQGGITAFTFTATPTQSTPLLESVALNHNGNAPLSNFSRLWLYSGNNRISEEVIPTQDQVTINFEPTLVLTGETEIELKLDTASNAEPGFTSRWSLTDIPGTDSNLPLHGQWLEIHPE